MTWNDPLEVTEQNFCLEHQYYHILSLSRCNWVDLLEKQSFWKFLHWLIIGRSRNWPDPRSPLPKFWDKHFVATDDLTPPWKFSIDSLKTVVMTLPRTFLEVGSHDLTWWPDLTWHETIIFAEGVELISGKVCKIWRRYAPPFFRYAQKTSGGGLISAPPPSVRGLKRYL